MRALALLLASVLWSSLAQAQIRIRSDFEAGTRAFERGDLKMAITFFRQGVEKGDAASEFALGTHYAYGEGVELDFGKAHKLLESSAAKGYPQAFTMLGIVHQRGKGVPEDPEKGLQYLRKAALLCDGQAQNHLAGALYEGRGTPRNKPEALAWLLLASERGEAAAKKGIEVVGPELGDKEQDEARDLYRKLKSQVICKPAP